MSEGQQLHIGASLLITFTGNLKAGDPGDWTEEHQGKVSFLLQHFSFMVIKVIFEDGYSQIIYVIVYY